MVCLDSLSISVPFTMISKFLLSLAMIFSCSVCFILALWKKQEHFQHTVFMSAQKSFILIVVPASSSAPCRSYRAFLVFAPQLSLLLHQDDFHILALVQPVENGTISSLCSLVYRAPYAIRKASACSAILHCWALEEVSPLFEGLFSS